MWGLPTCEIRRAMAQTLTLSQARAHWWRHQALDGKSKGTVASVIGMSGWLRTLGGADGAHPARARRPPMQLALRLLELRGEIERTLDGGQLDSERYLWRRVASKPRAASPERRGPDSLRPPGTDPLGRVIEAFLGYAGPATVAHIAAWS